MKGWTVRQVRRLLAVTGTLSVAALVGVAVGLGQTVVLAYVHIEISLPF
jgi:hypothetical protein